MIIFILIIIFIFNIDFILSQCTSEQYELQYLDGSTDCLNNIGDIPSNFYLISDKTYGECHGSCQECYGAAELNSPDTNCISCKEDFHKVEYFPTYCKSKDNDDDQSFLNNYYLDNEIYRKCQRFCETCNYGGNDDDNNCTTCKEGYFQKGTNCHFECPEGFFSFDYNSQKECVKTCREGFYLDLITKTCTRNCSSGSTENVELGLCTIESISYEDDDCEDIINDIIKEDNLKYYISDNSLIVGKNGYIQIYNSLTQNKIHSVADNNKLSKLFLSSDYINDDIVVIKIDYNQTYSLNPEVNNVVFFIYKKSIENNNIIYNNITDLDLITPMDGDDLIYIEKPLIYTENINLFKDKFEVFDIFNARNEIYNNFCIPFKSEYNTDLTYDYRRDVYFYNLSQYCLNDSTIYYSGFNSKTISIQCKANYIENVFTEGKMGDSRFKIFNCRQYLTKNLSRHYGFWVVLFFVVFNVGLFIPFIITRFTNIINFMRIFERGYNKPTGLKLKWTVLNPPKKNIKVIYKPKDFIITDDFFEEENELQLKYNYYLNNMKNKKNKKNKNNKNQNEKITNIGKNKNKTVYESKSSKSNLSSNNNSQINNITNSNNEKNKDDENISYSNNNNSKTNNNISNNNSISSSNSDTFGKTEQKKKEEEEKEKERKKLENQKFKEELSIKQKKENEKRKYKSYIMPHPEIKSIMKDYSKKQNKILENKPINTNLLTLDKIGNVVKNMPTETLNMKYEPKQYLNQYMFHNYDHLLPIPKSERVSSGTLSEDIQNELLKLQQLREKQMVERIFFKKIIANQKILKGYNEDFYPFTFDECIIRRKENATYKIIFWNYLREVNLIVNVIYDENYLDNRYLKIYLLGFSIYCMLFFNLLLYSDNYINDFYLHKGKYNFFFQITKSIFASLITVIIVKLMSLLVSSKIRLRKIIINRKYESDKDYIHDYKIILIILALKIALFFLILIAFLLIGWLYYILFSIPYPHSQKFVLVGTIFSFLIYEILSIGIVAIASGFKYSSIKSQSRGLYKAMSIVNLFL